MKQEFIKYEQALALKELGYDEPCIALFSESSLKEPYPNLFPPFYPEWCINAPTYSQAFRWFREKYTIRHNIMDFIDDETGIEWDYEIASIGTDLDKNGNYKSLVGYSVDDESRKFKTYEEAEVDCLDKLIEIVKKK